MKKIIFTILVLVCVLILTACMGTDSKQQSEVDNNSGIIIVDTEMLESMNEVENEEVYVADAAMYRGTVTGLEEKEDGTVITLSQASGTDFGAKTMMFLIDSVTTGYTDISEGNYIEVFYGRPLQGGFDYTDMQGAIGINNLNTADMVNFNGTIQSIEKDGENITSFAMVDIENNQEVVFRISNDTNMYLTASDLKEGDKLNIYHRGMYTLSLPPQGFALEIRYLAEL